MDTVFLDEEIPLRGASHADVVRYAIEVPMRNAECFGILKGGHKVPFENKRQFIGWSTHAAQRSMLFETDELRIEVRIDPNDPFGWRAPGQVCDIAMEQLAPDASATQGGATCDRKFIAVDGGLLFMPALSSSWQQLLAAGRVSDRRASSLMI
jgi:hypothetical protein